MQEKTAITANGAAPSDLDAGHKSERKAQLQRVARSDADIHEGQGRKSPSTGRIYDRNRTSIALIYASSTARLREESKYDLFGDILGSRTKCNTI